MRVRSLFLLALPMLMLARGTASAATAQEQHGADLYGRMCAVCHGARGEGYKADLATALANQDFLASVSDGFLKTAITFGRGGSTMSAWAAERGGPLSTGDVDALIAFLRTWRKKARVVLDEQPPTGDAKRGAGLYAQHCQKCHGANGVFGPNVRIGDARLLSTATEGFLRYAIAKGRPPTPMLGFRRVLGPRGIDDVIAYLREVAPSLPAVNAVKPSAPPLPLGRVPRYPAGPEPEGFKTFPATTPADLIHAELDRKTRMILLDARAPTDYANEHIAGASSVPFYDPSPYLPKLPKDVWLVCYCSCPHAESGDLARKLLAAGFTKVTVLDEGLGVWKTRGYPTTRGVAP